MNSVSRKAYAKINLTLDVLGKFDNGGDSDNEGDDSCDSAGSLLWWWWGRFL